MPSTYSSKPLLSADPSGQTGGFGLYVHWPFCQSKCPYCDFNSHVREAVDHDRWRAALVHEVESFAAMAPGQRLDAIFFGGGTPSLMQPATVEAVIDVARRSWGFSNNIEITMEANPGSVEAARFEAYAQAGVNRLSLGVQALDDASLQFLGRKHTATEAMAALDIAAKFFPRHSFDLIYARPHQTIDDWRRELATAIDRAGGHLSVYQLTIEPGTAFHGAYARGDFLLPDEDTAAALYETTQAMLSDAGMPAYEISNHATPGDESRHNLIYWRTGEWAGVGPGAHGRLTVDRVRTAYCQVRTPEAWLNRVEADGHGTTETNRLSATDTAAEALMMGLRLVEGVDLARFESIVGSPVEHFVDPTGLHRLIDGGFVTLDSTRLAATTAGLKRLNAVLPVLLRD